MPDPFARGAVHIPGVELGNGARPAPDTVVLNGQPVPVQHAILMMLVDIRDRLVEIRDAVQTPKEG